MTRLDKVDGGTIASPQGPLYKTGRRLNFLPGRPGHARGVVEREEPAGVKVLSVGPVMAPSRAAFALGIEAGPPVIARRRLVVADIGPIELATVYVPVEVAAGTNLGASQPIPGGALRHLTRRKG